MRVNFSQTLFFSVALASGLLVNSAASGADYLLVIDSSGSMQEKTADGTPKIQAAKQALIELGKDMSAHNVGVMMFGHTKNPNETGCCQDIEFVLPITEFDESSFNKVVDQLTPKGSTPLAESLTRSKYVMFGRPRESEKIILIVTDGSETCGGDPAAVAADIRGLKINIVTHVVGFDVNEKESEQLRNIATNGGGEFRTADDVDGLVKELKEIVVAKAPMPASEAKSEPATKPQPKPSSEKDTKSKPEAKPAARKGLNALEKALVARLKDAHYDVRIKAAQALHRLKSTAAVPALIERVQDETFYYGVGKQAAVDALKDIAPNEVEPILLKAAKAESANVRLWAAKCIVGIGGEVGENKFSALDQMLVDHLKDGHHGIRLHAAQSLHARKVKMAVPALVARIKDSTFYYGSGKAAALAALKDMAPDVVEETLIEALDSKNASLRNWATQILVPSN